ncbi:unnamed protein product [Polarella glacialis]|uniref:Uncharacterized protein n=1 Tax=Polarella glacialis TaxID=89957 RepID=A0A813G4X9_POLGL|nr:unnamed protein product [Polarella glacialis]
MMARLKTGGAAKTNEAQLAACEILWRVAANQNFQACSFLRKLMKEHDLPEVRASAARGIGKLALLGDRPHHYLARALINVVVPTLGWSPTLIAKPLQSDAGSIYRRMGSHRLQMRVCPAEQDAAEADEEEANGQEGPATEEPQQGTQEEQQEPELPEVPLGLTDVYPHLLFAVLDDVDEKGHPICITQDGDATVRCDALQSLAVVAKKGDRKAMAAAMFGLQDSTHAVREAAREAMLALHPPQDVAALVGLTQLLNHRTADVRRLAVKVLIDIADSGDQAVAGMVAQQLEAVAASNTTLGGVNAPERRMLLEALIRIAPKNDSSAVEAVFSRLGDVSSEVRVVALELLPQVQDTGGKRAAAAAAEMLKDRDASVRAAAARVLQEMGEPVMAQTMAVHVRREP